jgi:hypothetical protein
MDIILVVIYNNNFNNIYNLFKREHYTMTTVDREALQNLSSIFNSGIMKFENGVLKVKSIDASGDAKIGKNLYTKESVHAGFNLYAHGLDADGEYGSVKDNGKINVKNAKALKDAKIAFNVLKDDTGATVIGYTPDSNGTYWYVAGNTFTPFLFTMTGKRNRYAKYRANPVYGIDPSD